MAEPKTRPTDVDPKDFVAALPDPKRRADAESMLAMMARVTGEPAVMWGPNIVGFGTYPNKCGNRIDEWPRSAFAPRGKETVVYVVPAENYGADKRGEELARLGKHRIGKSCLYIKRLADVDEGVLEEMLAGDLVYMDKKYPR